MIFSTRQAAVIYFKHLIQDSWEQDKDQNQEKPFSIAEQDKIPIRNNMIIAIINAPEPIRFLRT